MSNDKVASFLFEGETVRVDIRGDDPWFFVADVGRAIGITNPAEAIRNLDPDEKGISTTDTPGGRQEMLIISESGLYSLIFSSRKPAAKKFKKWVTSEVIPAIRKTGGYFLPGMAIGHVQKPWADRSLEEQRVILSAINTCRMTHNQASAAWLWGHLGMPIPPAHLLPAWWQSELHLT